MATIRDARRRLCRLRADVGGVALLEFAFALPLVMGMGLYGVETANLALANMRVSQIALNLADNAGRVGVQNSLSIQQLRETDMNDVLAAARRQGQAWGLTTNGRITVSSLEGTGGNQVIHWQRCLGLKSGTGYDSSYGRTRISGGAPASADGNAPYDPTAGVDTDAGTTDNAASHPGSISTSGMGETGNKVTAPQGSGVMFVEVNYDYQPIVSRAWLTQGAVKLHYVASFIVRDNRDFTEIYNPSPSATLSTCDKYTS